MEPVACVLKVPNTTMIKCKVRHVQGQGSKVALSDRLRRPTIWEGLVQFYWACPIGRVPLLHSHVYAEGLTKSVSKYDEDALCNWLIEDGILLLSLQA